MILSRSYLLISLLVLLSYSTVLAQGKDAPSRIAAALNEILPVPKGISFSAENVRLLKAGEMSQLIQQDKRFTKDQRDELERRMSPQKDCKEALSYVVAFEGLCDDLIYFAGISCGGLNPEFYFYFFPDPNSKCIDQYYEWIEAGLITPNDIARGEGDYELCFPRICLSGQRTDCCVSVVQAIPVGKDCWEDNCNAQSDCNCTNSSYWIDLVGGN